MPDTPDWLCPLCELKDFGGDAIKYINALFAIFERDFIESKPTLWGKKVFFNGMPKYNGKPETFWHITSSYQGGVRAPDPRRCERIGWIKGLIENIDKEEVLVWENTRGRDARTLLFLEKEDYLVVLARRKSGFFLITAVYTDSKRRKDELLEEYRKFRGV